MNLLQPAPSPVGEGWGEGILRIAAIFPNTAISPIQALRLVALSLTLSHGREDRAAVGIKGDAGKIESCSPYVGLVRYVRVLHFPCNPNPPRACLAAHTLPMGSKVVWKNARGVCSICFAIGYLKNSCRWCFGHSFSDDLQRLNPLQPAPSPAGKGWGEGIPRMAAIFPKHLNRPNTSLAACCPLSNSLPRERGRAAVGVKGCCKEKRLCSSLHM